MKKIAIISTVVVLFSILIILFLFTSKKALLIRNVDDVEKLTEYRLKPENIEDVFIVRESAFYTVVCFETDLSAEELAQNERMYYGTNPRDISTEPLGAEEIEEWFDFEIGRYFPQITAHDKVLYYGSGNKDYTRYTPFKTVSQYSISACRIQNGDQVRSFIVVELPCRIYSLLKTSK